MIPPIIADTGGLLRALARAPRGHSSFPEYEKILTSAAAVVVPGLVLAEVDYFLRDERKAMRRLVAEIFDPATRDGTRDGTSLVQNYANEVDRPLAVPEDQHQIWALIYRRVPQSHWLIARQSATAGRHY